MSQRSSFEEWLGLALAPSVVRRACTYALIVGAILITINHGDAILKGDVSRIRILKMLLTICVPYTVSTLSSVGALRSRGASPPVPESGLDGTNEHSGPDPD